MRVNQGSNQGIRLKFCLWIALFMSHTYLISCMYIASYGMKYEYHADLLGGRKICASTPAMHGLYSLLKSAWNTVWGNVWEWNVHVMNRTEYILNPVVMSLRFPNPGNFNFQCKHHNIWNQGHFGVWYNLLQMKLLGIGGSRQQIVSDNRIDLH